MTHEKVQQLPLGLYLIFWRSGGSSLAAVGCTVSGSRWLAPVNWVHPMEDPKIWRSVARVTLLIAPQSQS